MSEVRADYPTQYVFKKKVHTTVGDNIFDVLTEGCNQIGALLAKRHLTNVHEQMLRSRFWKLLLVLQNPSFVKILVLVMVHESYALEICQF